MSHDSTDARATTGNQAEGGGAEARPVANADAPRRRRLLSPGRVVALAVFAVACLVALALSGLWQASNQLLFPSWHGAMHDLSVCGPELAAAWGEGCGNLRRTHALRFTEVSVPSLNGVDLPGWLVRAADNGRPAARGAILLVHGGGSDRRELIRHVPFLLEHGLDVLAVDLVCSGEAPCPAPGLSYGQRESRDVLSAYLFLQRRYARVLAMGSSAGAAAVLMALPAMPELVAAVSENAMASYQRLIREFPATHTNPAWMLDGLLAFAALRGHFDGLESAQRALTLVHSTPIFFIHSQRDQVCPVEQGHALAAAYDGPKTTWWPGVGGHSQIWDADRGGYETRLGRFLDEVLRG